MPSLRCLSFGRANVLAVAGLIASLGCGGNGETRKPESAPNLVNASTTPRAEPVNLPTCAAAPAEKASWKHRFGSRVTTKLGSPRHGASDVMAAPAIAASLEARFVYGKTRKDLEDENISVWLASEACDWKMVGRAVTDDDGLARMPLDAASIPAAGIHLFEMVVGGDLTRARGLLWVLAAETDIVVFDIDGTLTTGDDEIVEELLSGGTPEASPGAQEVVRKYTDAGYLPVYITGRPMGLSERSRSWLADFGFPAGPLALTRGFRKGLFSVQQFKEAQLVRLQRELKLPIAAAYGNASTDVCAYAKAGIPPSKVFIIGEHGGSACAGGDKTVAVSDYREHIKSIELQGPSAR